MNCSDILIIIIIVIIITLILVKEANLAAHWKVNAVTWIKRKHFCQSYKIHLIKKIITQVVGKTKDFFRTNIPFKSSVVFSIKLAFHTDIFITDRQLSVEVRWFSVGYPSMKKCRVNILKAVKRLTGVALEVDLRGYTLHLSLHLRIMQNRGTSDPKIGHVNVTLCPRNKKKNPKGLFTPGEHVCISHWHQWQIQMLLICKCIETNSLTQIYSLRSPFTPSALARHWHLWWMQMLSTLKYTEKRKSFRSV